MDSSMIWARLMESKGYHRVGQESRGIIWSKDRHVVSIDTHDLKEGKAPSVCVWNIGNRAGAVERTHTPMSELSSLLNALDDRGFATACVGMGWAQDLITPMLTGGV